MTNDVNNTQYTKFDVTKVQRKNFLGTNGTTMYCIVSGYTEPHSDIDSQKYIAYSIR